MPSVMSDSDSPTPLRSLAFFSRYVRAICRFSSAMYPDRRTTSNQRLPCTRAHTTHTRILFYLRSPSLFRFISRRRCLPAKNRIARAAYDVSCEAFSLSPQLYDSIAKIVTIIRVHGRRQRTTDGGERTAANGRPGIYTYLHAVQERARDGVQHVRRAHEQNLG